MAKHSHQHPHGIQISPSQQAAWHSSRAVELQITSVSLRLHIRRLIPKKSNLPSSLISLKALAVKWLGVSAPLGGEAPASHAFTMPLCFRVRCNQSFAARAKPLLLDRMACQGGRTSPKPFLKLKIRLLKIIKGETPLNTFYL